MGGVAGTAAYYLTHDPGGLLPPTDHLCGVFSASEELYLMPGPRAYEPLGLGKVPPHGSATIPEA